MGMDQTAAAGATVPADRADDGLTLAGLIDVLDRADDAIGPRRPRPRRAVLHRSPAIRVVADRWDPLREAAPSRPVPARPVRRRAVRSVPPAPAPRVPVRPMPATPAQAAPPQPSASPVRGARWRAALATLLRRAALWGAGPDGAHLAWGGPPPRPASGGRPTARRVADRRPVDPPVVLRELPSTPTDRPAAPSPAAAGAATAPRVERWVPPVSAGRPPARIPVSRGPVPSRARSPGGIRGSPGTAPARGSPAWWPEPG